MTPARDRILTYFNYNLEALLDEFNNYYNIKHHEMPRYIQTFFHYFTNLSEIGLQHLIRTHFPVSDARQIHLVLPNHEKRYTKDEFFQNMHAINLHPDHYYGLFIFSYFFYERFLDYIKFAYEKPVENIITQIPTIEANILYLLKIIKSPLR